MQDINFENMSDDEFFGLLVSASQTAKPCDGSCQGFCAEHAGFWDGEAAVEYKKTMQAKLELLLNFIESGRPSSYAPWRDCDKEKMLEILL